eukprot:3476375-Prymnesium_polylepis.1
MGAFDRTAKHGYLVSLGRVEAGYGTRPLQEHSAASPGRYVVYWRRYIVLKGSVLVEYPSLQHAASYESRHRNGGGWR